MQASFIIPTYNRAAQLEQCFEALLNQNFIKSEFEIVVVDDGSTDGTEKVVKKFADKEVVEIQYFRQENQGQGVARNLGIQKARGKVLLFIGDDIICVPDFLKEHMKLHDKYRAENEAVLGLILWHPSMKITPLMDFLTNGSAVLGRFGGHQFAFEKLEGKKMADYNFFYTSNISLKKSLLQKHSFDHVFSKYGWEDIELGYRLQKEEGMKLHYNNQAVAYHLHEIDDRNFKNRMKMIGKSARVIDQKYPELRKVPPFWKRFIFRLIGSRVALGFLKKGSAIHYYALSKKYFLEGLKE
jgi:glycosyltransferase involved in cell wall biosynthesis